MGKFRYFEQVCRSARHEATGEMRVVETERLLLQVSKHIVPHIGFNAITEHMAPVVYEPVAHAAHNVHDDERRNQYEKEAHVLAWNERVYGVLAYHRKKDIDCRHDGGANHIAYEKSEMRLVVRKENLKRALLREV